MYKERLGVPNEHDFVMTSNKGEQRKGRDTDIYGYEERNANGEVIAKYVVRDSMSIYPPQNTTVSFVKYDPEDQEIGSGTI